MPTERWITTLWRTDFEFTSGILTFGVGEISKTVTVTVLNDEILEYPESFNVELGATTGGLMVNDGIGVGLITDDDTQVTVSISDGLPAPATEGTDATITFTVTLSRAGRSCDLRCLHNGGW